MACILRGYDQVTNLFEIGGNLGGQFVSNNLHLIYKSCDLILKFDCVMFICTNTIRTRDLWKSETLSLHIQPDCATHYSIPTIPPLHLHTEFTVHRPASKCNKCSNHLNILGYHPGQTSVPAFRSALCLWTIE